MAGIVVAVDGSANSRKALETAVEEAALHHKPLTVLTVHQAIRDVYGAASHYGDDAALTDKARQAAQAETDEVLAAASARPESVTVTAVHGIPAEEIVKASEGADLLVIGRRGGGGFARLMMGSVTGQVTQHANSAVLIVMHAE
jgi:nucleotide-binding universal stress UspA family protein